MSDTIALRLPWRNKLGSETAHWLRSDKHEVDRHEDFQKKIILFLTMTIKALLYSGWTLTHNVVCVLEHFSLKNLISEILYSLFCAKEMDKLHFCWLH